MSSRARRLMRRSIVRARARWIGVKRWRERTGGDAQFALRRAHCALALGEDGDEATLGCVDRVFETLEQCVFSSDVRAAIALEASEIEEEWGRRCGRSMRERTGTERARAVETLGEDAFWKE